jgi:hypothetical protein
MEDRASKSVILRRRDDYARVLRELGGQLFARGGEVDKYFPKDEASGSYPNLERRARFTPMHEVGEPRTPITIEEAESMLAHNLGLTYSEAATVINMTSEQIADWRRKNRLQNHIRYAPERERAALRLANIRQACHVR